jgi:hypothetical protein
MGGRGVERVVLGSMSVVAICLYQSTTRAHSVAKCRNGQRKTGQAGYWSPVSPLAPPEAQRVGQGIAGMFMAFDLFWSGISGKN